MNDLKKILPRLEMKSIQLFSTKDNNLSSFKIEKYYVEPISQISPQMIVRVCAQIKIQIGFRMPDRINLLIVKGLLFISFRD